MIFFQTNFGPHNVKEASSSAQIPASPSAQIPASSPAPIPASSPVQAATLTSVADKRPFEIPNMWRPSILSAIQCHQLSTEVRNEICRDLITLLYTYEKNPGAVHCKKVAALLICKYPFMADTGINKSVRGF